MTISDTHVIRLPNQLQLASPLQDEFAKVTTSRVVLDFTDVVAISAAHIAEIVRFHREEQPLLLLRHLNDELREMFTHLDLDELLNIEE